MSLVKQEVDIVCAKMQPYAGMWEWLRLWLPQPLQALLPFTQYGQLFVVVYIIQAEVSNVLLVNANQRIIIVPMQKPDLREGS